MSTATQSATDSVECTDPIAPAVVQLGCPCCGSTDVNAAYRRVNAAKQGYYCRCNGCGLRQGGEPHATVTAAIRAWNTRSAPAGFHLVPIQLDPAQYVPVIWRDEMTAVELTREECDAADDPEQALADKRHQLLGWLSIAWKRLIELAPQPGTSSTSSTSAGGGIHG